MMTDSNKQWTTLCHINELVENSGVCALTYNKQQVALFKLPSQAEQVFAISNYDPIGQANVLYRGIVGCDQGEPVVASPLYKQQFSLKTGKCIQEDAQVEAYPTRLTNEMVEIFV